MMRQTPSRSSAREPVATRSAAVPFGWPPCSRDRWVLYSHQARPAHAGTSGDRGMPVGNRTGFCHRTSWPCRMPQALARQGNTSDARETESQRRYSSP